MSTFNHLAPVSDQLGAGGGGWVYQVCLIARAHDAAQMTSTALERYAEAPAKTRPGACR